MVPVGRGVRLVVVVALGRASLPFFPAPIRLRLRCDMLTRQRVCCRLLPLGLAVRGAARGGSGRAAAAMRWSLLELEAMLLTTRGPLERTDGRCGGGEWGSSLASFETENTGGAPLPTASPPTDRRLWGGGVGSSGLATRPHRCHQRILLFRSRRLRWRPRLAAPLPRATGRTCPLPRHGSALPNVMSGGAGGAEDALCMLRHGCPRPPGAVAGLLDTPGCLLPPSPLYALPLRAAGVRWLACSVGGRPGGGSWGVALRAAAARDGPARLRRVHASAAGCWGFLRLRLADRVPVSTRVQM